MNIKNYKRSDIEKVRTTILNIMGEKHNRDISLSDLYVCCGLEYGKFTKENTKWIDDILYLFDTAGFIEVDLIGNYISGFTVEKYGRSDLTGYTFQIECYWEIFIYHFNCNIIIPMDYHSHPIAITVNTFCGDGCIDKINLILNRIYIKN